MLLAVSLQEDKAVEKVLVKFQVLRIPESSGLRIKTLEPVVGLYVSSVNAEAAQYYFERTLFSLIIRLKLLPVDGGLTFDKSIDWQACIEVGGGEVVVQTVTQERALEVMRTEIPDLLPLGVELVVRWMSNKSGSHICFITDTKDSVDLWIVESVMEQAMRHGKAANSRPA